MKKLIVFGVFALLSWGATAQPATQIGLKAGVNLSDITEIHKNYKASFLIGGYANFQFIRWFSLQPEVFYSRLGASDKYGNTRERIRLNYLNVPLMGRFWFGERLSVDVGPQLGVNLSGRYKIRADKDNNYIRILSNNQLQTIEFSVVGGLSYRLRSGIGISVRYQAGLTDVFKMSLTDRRTRNSVFQVSVSVPLMRF